MKLGGNVPKDREKKENGDSGKGKINGYSVNIEYGGKTFYQCMESAVKRLSNR